MSVTTVPWLAVLTQREQNAIERIAWVRRTLAAGDMDGISADNIARDAEVIVAALRRTIQAGQTE